MRQVRALARRDVFFLRNQDMDYVTAQAKVLCYGIDDDAVELVLPETSVR